MSSEKEVNSGSQSSQNKERANSSEPKVKIAPTNPHNGNRLCPPEKNVTPEGKFKNKKAENDYRKRMKSCRNHLFREIRVEIQEIARVINQHIDGQLDIISHIDELQGSREDVNRIFNELNTIYFPELEPRDLDSEMINLWEMIEPSTFLDASKSSVLGNMGEQEKLRELNLLKTRISRLIYFIGYSTTMERLNNWVSCARPGYALPFNRIFEDEISSDEERQHILNLFSLQPRSLEGGLIDPARGVILCYPSNMIERVIRYLLIIFLLIFSFKLVGEFSSVLSASDTLRNSLNIVTVPDAQILTLSWAALLFGIIGHILVAGAKLTSADFRQFPMPIHDWGYYLSARTSMLIYKITLALLVFVAVFVSLKGEIGLLDAFLIGN